MKIELWPRAIHIRMANNIITGVAKNYLIVALLQVLFVASASAQKIPPPRQVEVLDQNGVDLVSGALILDRSSHSIGVEGSGLTVQTSVVIKHSNEVTDGWASFTAAMNFMRYPHDVAKTSDEHMLVTYNNSSSKFKFINGVYEPWETRDEFSCAGDICTLTKPDGTQVYFDKTITASGWFYKAEDGAPTKVVKPDGEELHYNYSGAGANFRSVLSTLGWMMSGAGQMQLVNVGADYCDPTNSSFCRDLTQYPIFSSNMDALGNKVREASSVDVDDKGNRTYELTLRGGVR